MSALQPVPSPTVSQHNPNHVNTDKKSIQRLHKHNRNNRTNLLRHSRAPPPSPPSRHTLSPRKTRLQSPRCNRLHSEYGMCAVGGRRDGVFLLSGEFSSYGGEYEYVTLFSAF